MPFKEVLGQERARKILSAHIQKKRFHHAYLFCGPAGVGKSMAGVEFAQAIFCPHEPLGYCGDCTSCRKFAGGNHPDYQEIKTEDPTIKIETIRTLRRSLTLKPYESAYRVFLLVQAEKLTSQAANSFLKSLEEPPPHVIFILTSDNRDSLLPTILSRTFPVSFNLLPKKIIEDKLAGQIKKTQERKILAELAQGRLGFAQKLARSEDFLVRRTELLRRWTALNGASFLDVYNFVQWIMEAWSDEYEVFFQFLKLWFRDLFYWKEGERERLINTDALELLEKEVSKWEEGKLEEALLLIDNLQGKLERSINQQLAFEATLLQINSWRQ